VSITVGSGNKNAGGALSIVAGSTTDTSTGAAGVGGALDMTAGSGAKGTGGAVTLTSGKGAASSSGALTIKTVDAGTNGISGSLVFTTGASTKGDSGSVTLSTGAGVGGKSGAVSISTGVSTVYDGGAITIAGGASNAAAGNSIQRTGGAVTISSGDGGGSGGLSAKAGDIVLLPGKGADANKHGKLILKSADGSAGEAVVTISSTNAVSKYALTADDIDITSQTTVDIASLGALALTTNTGQTMTLGANGGLLLAPIGVVAKLEGGLAVGRPCVGTGAEACGDSGNLFNPLRATITRIIKATCTVDASAGIAAGAEKAFVCLLGVAKLYDTATASPPGNPGASLLWNAYVRDGKIIIIVANMAASAAYSTNSNWHIVLFKYTTYTSTDATTTLSPDPDASSPATFPTDLALSGISPGETFVLTVTMKIDSAAAGAYQTTIIGSGDECVNPEGADADPKGQTYFYGDEFIASAIPSARFTRTNSQSERVFTSSKSIQVRASLSSKLILWTRVNLTPTTESRWGSATVMETESRTAATLRAPPLRRRADASPPVLIIPLRSWETARGDGGSSGWHVVTCSSACVLRRRQRPSKKRTGAW